MALTRARAIRDLERPYTRKSKVKSKGYIKTVPPNHIVKFVMGDSAKFLRGEYSLLIRLVSKDSMQIRDNAIEACRTHILRELEKTLGKDFCFIVSVYPHQILREHKQAAVAQADRIFQGMQMAFGKPTSLAAQIKVGKDIFRIALNDESAIPNIRIVLHKIKPKLSCRTVIVVKKIGSQGMKQIKEPKYKEIESETAAESEEITA